MYMGLFIHFAVSLILRCQWAVNNMVIPLHIKITFMTYHQSCNNRNTTCFISGSISACISGTTTEFTTILVGLCCSIFSFLMVLVLSVLLWTSGYPFGIFWLPLWYLLVTPLVSFCYSFGIFWLPPWYLLVTPLVSSGYPFAIFWLPLW